MCLESLDRKWNRWKWLFPAEEMVGFKLLDTGDPGELHSPFMPKTKWEVGVYKKAKSVDGFYFFPTIQDAVKYSPNALRGSSWKIFPVTAYEVFQKGTALESSAIAYRAKAMCLTSDVPIMELLPLTREEKDAAIEECMADLGKL